MVLLGRAAFSLAVRMTNLTRWTNSNWYYGESVYGKLFEMTSLPVEIAVVLMMTMIPLNFSFQIYKIIISNQFDNFLWSFNNNNHLQNELVAWLDKRGVHKPLRPIDVPEQQFPLQLFTDDLRFIVKLFFF